MTQPARRDVRRLLLTLRRSFAMKLALLVVVFVAVPVIVYNELRDADQQQQQLLVKSVRDRGRLVAESLRPLLDRDQAAAVLKLSRAIEPLATPDLNVKVLFRPETSTGESGFYYVATAPPVPMAYLESERVDLMASGIFDLVRDSCASFASPAVRYTNPSGKEEVLTSVNPILTKAGCWVVITSSTADDILGSSLGQSYWKTPEVRVAAAIYLLMALFVISLFADGWRSLRHFTQVARRIRTRGKIEGSFADKVVVPELAPVAREFDGLVAALDGSARMIRYAAEDNAHAFKTPIAVIAQSIESLRRSVGADDARGQRSLALVEQALERLDGLVGTARHMDEAAAELIDPPREPVDLTSLVGRLAEDYADSVAQSSAGCRVVVEALPHAKVLGSEDLIETVLENLLDNAVSFSPRGGRIRVGLRLDRSFAVVSVEDDGPGVDPGHLERIFDRYFSYRQNVEDKTNGEPDGGTHFGIGLWVVRRNVEALGGTVTAENRTPHGLAVRVRLPLA
jgi:two-component system, OmpR family, sensor histidine kinase ChvG